MRGMRRAGVMVIAVAAMSMAALVLAQSTGGSPARPASAPVPKAVIHATVHGVNYCVACGLKKQKNAGAQCEQYGHRHALRVTKAVDKSGNVVDEMRGRVLHYLETEKSQALLHGLSAEACVIEGKIYPLEGMLEVDEILEPAVGKPREVRWHRTVEEGLAEAKTYNTLVLVEVTSLSCGWCKKLETETFTDAKVKEKLNEFALVRLDFDRYRSKAIELGASGTPHSVVLDKNGKRVASQNGYLDARPYLKFLDEAAKKKPAAS